MHHDSAGDVSGDEEESDGTLIIPQCGAPAARFIEGMHNMYCFGYPASLQPFGEVDQLKK